MAKKFQSKPEKKAARERAEAHFTGGKANGKAAKKGPRIIPDLLASDNGPKPRDFLHHLRTAKGFKSKLDEANGHYRNALKQAKEAGVDPAVITATMKWEKKDPLEAQSYFKQLRSMFEAAGIEVQLSMFDEASVSRNAQIYDDGFKAGKAGKSSTDNPHDPSTAANQTWMQGWSAGQAENIKGIGQTPADAQAAAH